MDTCRALDTDCLTGSAEEQSSYPLDTTEDFPELLACLIHDNLHRLYDAFGPARWFWGTDVTRMPCPWRQCVTLFTEELTWLHGRDLELVMGRGVCDWIGWKR